VVQIQFVLIKQKVVKQQQEVVVRSL